MLQEIYGLVMLKALPLAGAAVLLAGLGGCAHAQGPLRPDKIEALDKKADKLLASLTLSEKIAELSGLDFMDGKTNTRLGIPPLLMTDGPHGTKDTFGPATCFPTLVTLGASWDVELAQRYGAALGEETRGQGRNVLLGPCINLHRTPLGGRNFESFGEDPCLVSRLAVAYIQGVQSQNVAACVKHFAANNQETSRTRVSAQIGERALRELYLPAFQAAVTQGGVATVMGAYNRVNGDYCCQNRVLLTDLLKTEWGFQGLVMSDWGAIHDSAEALNAGCDLEMPGPALFFSPEKLLPLLASGQLQEKTIDQAVRRILRVKLALGLFDGTGRKQPSLVNTRAHQDLARETAEAGIVLLKNDGHLLPLDLKKLKSLAVIGPNSASARLGGGGSSTVTPPYAVSPLAGIRRKCGSAVEVSWEPGCLSPGDVDPVPAASPGQMLQKAVAAAARSEAAVVVVGLSNQYEGEGLDRRDLALPPGQNELIRAVAAANPRTVVVLINGTPLDMRSWVDKIPAVLEAWYPGMEGGTALANILCGDVNPSGKLPVTFPKKLEDNPAYANYPGDGAQVQYAEGVFVGYRYYDQQRLEPLFPFGHGLSYTTFAYAAMQVTPAQAQDGPFTVRLSVKNTGLVAGQEVVQLYLSPAEGFVPRPPQELKAFKKIALQPGETQNVSFTLDWQALAFYDAEKKSWWAEPGKFILSAGSSSRDLRVKSDFTLLP